MRPTVYTAFCVSAILTLLFSIPAQGQTPEVKSAQQAVNKVLEDSGRYFREGMTELKANRRTESGEKFDKAVEVFLFSTLNTQSDQRLQSCYSQLLETVYRMEFPSETQVPQIRSLSATCAWQWNDEDFKLADAVAQIVKPGKQAAPGENAQASAVNGTENSLDTLIGFNVQTFEPSPLDELSKLELTNEELTIEGNPEAQTQYQYIQYAVSN